MDDLHDAIAELARSLEILERRVRALEQLSRIEPPVFAQAPNVAPITSPLEIQTVAQGPSALSVLGKAMLGMAGAYLLRALAGSPTFPRTAVVAIGIAYTVFWLVAATWTPVEARFARIAYASTSALILIPMLWEVTLRFGTLSTAFAAGVLVAYVLSASALTWKSLAEPVASIAHAAGSIAALVLAIATHDPAPFVVALLVVALANEFSAALGHKLKVRPVAAALADVAVCAMISIYSSPEGARPDYKVVSATLLPAFGLVLLTIYGVSANVYPVARRRPIGFFEIVETLVAFLLAAWGVLTFWPRTGQVALGILCFVFAAAGYTAVFARVRGAADGRNFHAYAGGSLALFLAGSYLCLPHFWLPVSLSAAAIVAFWLGERRLISTLVFHGLVFLLAAAFTSGLLAYDLHAVAGTFPGSPRWIVAIVSLCAVACYSASGRLCGDDWSHRLLYLFSAALAVSSTAAMLVWGLVKLAAEGGELGTFPVAVLRTLTICALALALAYSGVRWQRNEMAWMAYAMLAFAASKLVFEDMRQGHLGFTAASIFLYAVTLLLVPRLVRLASKARGA